MTTNKKLTGTINVYGNYIVGATLKAKNSLANANVTLEKIVWSGPKLADPHGVNLLLGDFDEDGNPDIFSLVDVDPPFGKFPDLLDFNNIIISGPISRIKEFPEFKGFWYGGASGDINNDGHIDIVMFNFNVGANDVQNQILWNDGNANFRFDINGLANLQHPSSWTTWRGF